MHTAFFIRMNGKFQAIPFDSVLYITSKKNYCEIVTVTKKKFVTYGSISYFELKLPENLFCRSHRSYIISLQKIDSFDSNNVVVNKEELPLSKEGYEKVLQRVILICPDHNRALTNEVNNIGAQLYLDKFRAPVHYEN